MARKLGWDLEDDGERDFMSEEQAEEIERQIASAPAPRQTQQYQQPEEIYEEEEQYDFTEEDVADAFSDESLENDEELLNSASLRLEQGRLYEMLAKHDLFGDVNASPKAIANVQREIRQFVNFRLEVLLGMKPDTGRPQPQQKQDFPFTDLEVDLIKKLLSKLSKGATEKYSNTEEEVPAPIQPKPVKPQAIKPLSTPKPVQPVKRAEQPKPKPQVQARPQPQQKQPPKPQPKVQPQQRNRPKTRQQQIADLEAELEATAKPFKEMSSNEIQERNIQISKLEALKKPPRPRDALPMPTNQETEMVYARQAQAIGGKMTPLITQLINTQEE